MNKNIKLFKIIKDYLSINLFKKKIKKQLNTNKFLSQEQVLIEFNGFQNFHISASYLANYLKNKYQCQLLGFFNYSILLSDLNFSFLNKLKWILGNLFSVKNFGVYKSIGADKIFRPNIKKYELNLAEIKFIKLKKEIKNKKDVLSIRLDGILIGDIIYDTYLKKFYEPTIQFDDKFFKLLKDFLILYYYWKNYFRKNKVKAIITGHFVYSYALVVRVALKYDIKCFNVSLMRIFRASKRNNTFAFDGKTLELKKIIKETDKKILLNGIKLSKKILQKRVNKGKLIGGDLPYVLKSSFTKKDKHKRFIVKNKKKKVLICMHDFFDAVHLNRNNLFVDFSEWLEFLGKLSEKTNYDWYIKTHPYYDKKFKFYQSISFRTMKQIIGKYNKIKILPNEYSHKRIVKEGIDLVLTVYGSVAMEYALMNKLVITACKNNLFCDFNFNIHPKSIEDYKNKILNFEKIRLKINKNEIYQYYYARHLHHDVNWILPNYSKFIKKIGYNNQFTTQMYSKWSPYFKKKHTKRILSTINSFYYSKNDFLNIYHSKNYLKYTK
jgi:hypothetical protein